MHSFSTTQAFVILRIYLKVQPFSDEFTIDDVEEGDVLLIELNDEKFRGRKIRVMDHAEGNAFATYYYVGNKKRQVSSKLHSFDSIRGVVREVNHPYRDVAYYITIRPLMGLNLLLIGFHYIFPFHSSRKIFL